MVREEKPYRGTQVWVPPQMDAPRAVFSWIDCGMLLLTYLHIYVLFCVFAKLTFTIDVDFTFVDSRCFFIKGWLLCQQILLYYRINIPGIECMYCMIDKRSFEFDTHTYNILTLFHID